MSPIINILHLLIFIFLTFFSQVNSKKQIMYLEGDQLDSQISLSTKTESKLFLVFYVKNCQYCTHALQILKNKIVKNFEDEDEIAFGSINLDEQKNIWLGLRFNVTRIPYIILIEKNKMYKYENTFEEELVMEFINKEKNIEDGDDIPPPTTFFSKFKAAMKELSEKVENVLIMFGLKKEWSSKITYFIIFFALCSFIYLENKLIDFCKNSFFRKNKNKKIEINENINEKNKGDNNINKEKDNNTQNKEKKE